MCHPRHEEDWVDERVSFTNQIFSPIYPEQFCNNDSLVPDTIWEARHIFKMKFYLKKYSSS